MFSLRRNRDIRYINPTIPPFDLSPLAGTRYSTRVPDTLDLAERAAQAIHCLTASTDPEANSEIYWIAWFGWQPPTMYHDLNDWVEYKYYAPTELLRLACGSDEGAEVSWHRMANLLQMQGPDGLLYLPVVGRPWGNDFGADGSMYTAEIGEQMMVTAMSGRMIEAAGTYYRLTGDAQWLELGARAIAALRELAVDCGDYAYFMKIIYAPGERLVPGPVPPPHLNHGQVWLANGLMAFYRMTGHAPALEFGHKLARFFLSHSDFVGPDGEFRHMHGDPSFDTRGRIHFHTNTLIRVAMLEAGIEAYDDELIGMALRGYEYGKSRGQTLMGYFPENLGYDDVHDSSFSTESCEVADMIHLGRALSLAGIRDCWDDVDRWVRNIFSEGQLLDAAWAYTYAAREGITEQRPYSVTEGVPDRFRGGWSGWITPNDWQGSPTASACGCCIGNAARQLYMVWRDMVRYEPAGNRFTINLLLNRASPWADVNSHLPYRSQVDVLVKQACTVSLRIPEWAAAADCHCELNGHPVQPGWQGRYLQYAAQPGDIFTFRCPIAERSEMMETFGNRYRMTIKGNEIIDIDPPGTRHPIFRKPQYRSDETRWRTVERFVAERLVETY